MIKSTPNIVILELSLSAIPLIFRDLSSYISPEYTARHLLQVWFSHDNILSELGFITWLL